MTWLISIGIVLGIIAGVIAIIVLLDRLCTIIDPNIIWFIIGFIIGTLVIWIYNQVTDKVQLAKTGYGIGKSILFYILNKFKK